MTQGARNRHRIPGAQGVNSDPPILGMKLQITAHLAGQGLRGTLADRWRGTLIAAQQPAEQRDRRLGLRVVCSH